MHFIACIHMLAGAAEFMLPVTDVMCGVTRRAGTASHLLYDVSLGRTTISNFCVARVTLKRRLESSVPRLPKRMAFQSGCAAGLCGVCSSRHSNRIRVSLESMFEVFHVFHTSQGNNSGVLTNAALAARKVAFLGI